MSGSEVIYRIVEWYAGRASGGLRDAALIFALTRAGPVLLIRVEEFRTCFPRLVAAWGEIVDVETLRDAWEADDAVRPFIAAATIWADGERFVVRDTKFRLTDGLRREHVFYVVHSQGVDDELLWSRILQGVIEDATAPTHRVLERPSVEGVHFLRHGNPE